MKLLVTGAGGQLGRCLARLVGEQRQMEVRLVGRDQLDLAQTGSADQLVKSWAPDLIINAAAYTDVERAEEEPDLAMRVNAIGVGELAGAAWRNGARLLHLSTDYVFAGDRGAVPYDEAAQPEPVNAYGRSKLAGEAAVLEAHPQAVVIRTAWLYSAIGRNFVNTMMGLALRRDSVEVVHDQVGNPTDAGALAADLLGIVSKWERAPHQGLGGIYHCAGRDILSWAELAELVFAACRRLGAPSAIVRRIATAAGPGRARRPAFSALSCDKLLRDFSLPPHAASHRLVERVVAGIAERANAQQLKEQAS